MFENIFNPKNIIPNLKGNFTNEHYFNPQVYSLECFFPGNLTKQQLFYQECSDFSVCPGLELWEGKNCYEFGRGSGRNNPSSILLLAIMVIAMTAILI